MDSHGDNKKHQVVDSHGYDKNQLNILHAHHCNEQVFNNPISTHCEQNRDALRENFQGTSFILTTTKLHRNC